MAAASERINLPLRRRSQIIVPVTAKTVGNTPQRKTRNFHNAPE
jgi:hypothetical protein